jgi:thiamine-monophosphate kinase
VDEFALIRQFFADLTPSSEGLVLGIGDDAALLEVPASELLVVTTDTLVAGRHFPLDTAPFDIGWKALAVNLSDLAAMAALPRWFTLALTVPTPDAAWLQGFAAGLKALAVPQGIALVGGDTTRGPLTITLTAMGTVPSGQALRRDGARPGDCIAVTGTLGDAALALRQLGRPGADAWLRARLDRPTPRIEVGMALRGLASAALDVSDGLAADLGHILAASGVGAELIAEQLPCSEAFRAQAGDDALSLQLHGGDDYELCLCLSPSRFSEAQSRLGALGLPLTVIGTVTEAAGLWLRRDGMLRALPLTGYQHFA